VVVSYSPSNIDIARTFVVTDKMIQNTVDDGKIMARGFQEQKKRPLPFCDLE
jgi:hypothetical protein